MEATAGYHLCGMVGVRVCRVHHRRVLPRIVGWNVAGSLKTELSPLPALEMAARDAASDLGQLVHHSDRGSNYVSLVYTDRLHRGERVVRCGFGAAPPGDLVPAHPPLR